MSAIKTSEITATSSREIIKIKSLRSFFLSILFNEFYIWI